MPRMGGEELSRKILEVRPSTKVIYMTGYIDRSACTRITEQQGVLLQKPFKPSRLLLYVREALTG